LKTFQIILTIVIYDITGSFQSVANISLINDESLSPPRANRKPSSIVITPLNRLVRDRTISPILDPSKPTSSNVVIAATMSSMVNCKVSERKDG
jgi:hypothetical protein